jgi:hypothetical protein
MCVFLAVLQTTLTYVALGPQNLVLVLHPFLRLHHTIRQLLCNHQVIIQIRYYEVHIDLLVHHMLP